MIADAQALTDNADNPAKVRDNIMEAGTATTFRLDRSGEVSYFYPVLRDGADGVDILLPESGYGLQIAAQPDG